MKPFLETVSENLYQVYEGHLHTLGLVVPSRRALYYLEQYMLQKTDKPLLMPHFYTIESLQVSISGLEQASELDLLFLLYEAYNETVQPADDLGTFLGWAPKLLGDFEEIDNQLIEARQLFSYLTQEKMLDFWNPSQTTPGPFAQKHLAFYRNLYAIYELFKSKLETNKKGYNGMLAKKSAAYPKLPMGVEHLVFIGFNALTKAEEELINHFSNLKQLSLFWDADPMFEEQGLSGGDFIKKYKTKTWQQTYITNGGWKNSLKTIHLVETTNNYFMARASAAIAGNMLAEVTIKHHCGLVLCDETMLLPTLSGLPPSVEHFNVTMGYPLNHAQCWQVLLLWFGLHERYQSQKGYFYDDVQRLLLNPLLQKSEIHKEINLSFLKAIIQNNMIYVRVKVLEQSLKPIWGNGNFEALFWPIAEGNLIYRLYALLDLMKQWPNLQKTELILLNHIIAVVNRIKQATEQYPQLLQASLLLKFLKEWINQSAAKFIGEPAKGLQILGLLETRLIDFDKIVLVSANEGQLPKVSKRPSFLTYSILKQFNLPHLNAREALSSYYFYRLLSRASEVYLLYSGVGEGIGKQEKSRYLVQLTHHLKEKLPNISINNYKWQPKSQNPTKHVLSFEQPKLQAQILDFLCNPQKGISATAIKTYQRCKLQFALQYLLRLDDEHNMEEEIGADVMGKAIHTILENWLKPYINKSVAINELLPSDPEAAKMAMREQLTATFKSLNYPKEQLKNGINYLTFEISFKYIWAFMQIELVRLSQKQTVIVGLEQKLVRTLAFKLPQKEDALTIYIKGTIDRIDFQEGRIQIWDYKTGKTDPDHLKFTEKTQFSTKSDNKALLFQLLLYSWLYEPNLGIDERLETGLISLRQLSAPYMQVVDASEAPLSIGKKEFSIVENILQDLLTEWFDKETIFEQTKNEYICTTCHFKQLCGKK